MANNEIIAVCRKHWTNYIIPAVIAIFFAFGAIGVAISDDFSWGAFVMCVVFSLFAILYIWANRGSVYIELKETQIIIHDGLKTRTCPLSTIQDVGVSWGLFGSTVVIRNAATDGAEIVFKRMAKGEAFVRTVQNQLAAREY